MFIRHVWQVSVRAREYVRNYTKGRGHIIDWATLARDTRSNTYTHICSQISELKSTGSAKGKMHTLTSVFHVVSTLITTVAQLVSACVWHIVGLIVSLSLDKVTLINKCLRVLWKGERKESHGVFEFLGFHMAVDLDCSSRSNNFAQAVSSYKHESPGSPHP